MTTVTNPTDNTIKFMYDNGLGQSPGACLPGQTIDIGAADVVDESGLLEIVDDEEVVVVDKPNKPDPRQDVDFEDVKKRSRTTQTRKDPRTTDPRS